MGYSFRYNDFMKNIDAIFASEEFALTTVGGIIEARDNSKNGDFIIDLRGSIQLNDIIKISVIIDNLMNREYMTRPANMMPPRKGAIQISMKI